jgi:hypothetical protein
VRMNRAITMAMRMASIFSRQAFFFLAILSSIAVQIQSWM